tara:strand:+ start:3105 stop:3386 length:282 start_codon:yes stop_codon:yes gene_type:complete
MNKRNLHKLRIKIDSIDNKIFALIKKRTLIVKKMLKLKENKKDIVDHKRIREILKKIRRKSLINKVDPKITQMIWRSIIWSYIAYQRKKFRKK